MNFSEKAVGENTMSEIGQKLRDARVEKGYTLDDLQQITKIQKRYLIAIEEGHFDKLPGDFYVRAFVKQYADTVGLDSDELLSEFNDTIPQVQPQEVVTPEAEEPTSRQAKHIDNPTLAQISHYLPTIIIGAVVVIIVIVIAVFAHGNRQHAQKQVIDQSSSVSVSNDATSKKKKASSSQASSASASSQTSKKSSDTVKLTMTTDTTTAATFTYTNAPATNTLVLHASSSKQAWTSVTAGSSTVWQGTLSDTKQTVKIPSGSTSFVIQTGNASNLVVKLNDKKFNFDPNNVGGIVKKITVNLSGTAAASSASSSSASTTTTSGSTGSSQTVTQ
jgi:cytoskeletal protein RodZ